MSVIAEREELTRLMATEAVDVVFQPVFDLHKRSIKGYEALSRGPANSPLHRPDQLFAVAQACGSLSELELICRKRAIHRFVELKLDGKLFLNVSPQVLLDNQHPRGETMVLLEQLGLSADRLVIEITENQKVDETLLKQAVQYYRRLGFTIAIDDLGAGHSGLRQWSELMPDIVKIDRYFVHNCHQDVVKREFLKFILSLAKVTNAQVIAEGIEQPAELRLLASLGVTLTQGYLLQRPTPLPATEFPSHIDACLTSCDKSIPLYPTLQPMR